MLYVDLTQPLTDKTPVYPGDPETKIKPSAKMESDGYNDYYISFGTHVGTHVDAPVHMLAGGKTLDQYDVEKFIGRGVVIDARGKNVIDVDVLDGAEIKARDIVLFYTGTDKKYTGPEYFENYPTLTEDLAGELVARQVSMVGVDTCSPDVAPFDVHKFLLRNDILILENLTSLEKLVSKDCKIYALPLKLALDGAQVRVVAEVQ